MANPLGRKRVEKCLGGLKNEENRPYFVLKNEASFGKTQLLTRSTLAIQNKTTKKARNFEYLLLE